MRFWKCHYMQNNMRFAVFGKNMRLHIRITNIAYIQIAHHELLDHLAVILGLLVVQTKLRMLISQDILNIHRAYAEWAWHFLGFKVFAEFNIYDLSYLVLAWSFLRAKAAMLSARLSYRNSVRPSVRPSVCPSVCHTGGSGKNGPS